jgi:hypothetical protein
MMNYGRVWIAASMAAMTVTSLVACDGGDSSAVAAVSANPAAGSVVSGNGTVNACDGIRRHLKSQAIKDFGFDHMVDAMKKISGEIAKEQREDLIRFTTAIDTNGINPQLYRQSTQMIQSIYADAIERTGLKAGVAEAADENHRAMTAEPSGEDPLADGYTQVLTSSAVDQTVAAPAVGTVTKALLGVSADQTSYEFLFVRIKSVSPGPNHGFEANGDTITMSQYVESVMPASCAQIGSALPPNQLNRLSAN